MKVYDTHRHFLKLKMLPGLVGWPQRANHPLSYEDLNVKSSSQNLNSRIVRMNYMIDALILVNAIAWPSLFLVEFMNAIQSIKPVLVYK